MPKCARYVERTRPGDAILHACRCAPKTACWWQGRPEAINDLLGYNEFSSITAVTDEALRDDYELHDHTFVVRVPHGSGLGGTTLEESGLTSAFDFRVLAMFRDGELHIMPEPTDTIQDGQLLLLQGRPEDLDDFARSAGTADRGHAIAESEYFEADRLATVEVALAPRSSFVGQSAAAINFRERSGLELSAIWRSGTLIRDDLPRQTLQFGDALLLIGPHEKLARLNEDADLLVMTRLLSAKRIRVAHHWRPPSCSALLSWRSAAGCPSPSAAILGATTMILTGCLSMEQAYRCHRLACRLSDRRHAPSSG